MLIELWSYSHWATLTHWLLTWPEPAPTVTKYSNTIIVKNYIKAILNKAFAILISKQNKLKTYKKTINIYF